MADAIYRLAGKRVWVAGHLGMVGSALVRRLEDEHCDILTADRRTLDLERQAEVEDWISDAKPDAIFLAAAKVGGIQDNILHPADFLYKNLMIESNIINSAHRVGVEKLMFFGSSCIYPKFADQPIREDALLTGALEPSNEWYAVAKIAGIKLCQSYRRQFGRDFISVMPTNLYGPGDNFDLRSSHVLPALLRKVHEAKSRHLSEMTIWGTGRPIREFLHVDDCSDACIHVMKAYSGDSHINIGSASEISILKLARLISTVVGFEGSIAHDLSKPDGTPRKLMDSQRLRDLGWNHRIGLEDGIRSTYEWFLANRTMAKDE